MSPKVSLLIVMCMLPPLSATAAPCESLASLSLPNTTITMAQTVPAGQFKPPAGTLGGATFANLPAFCRVTATLTPSSDSDIRMEVWLPVAGWNGNFQPAGNGGWGGTISYGDLAGMLLDGFATAGSDTGHSGDFSGASFALGHPEKLKDFGYRAFQETTVKAKAMIAAFYGNGPKLSLINQCGGGGRMALSAVQRFPNEYDAVAVAGFDGHKTSLHFGQIAVYQATHRTPGRYIPPEKFPMIHQAAMNRCDALVDGVKDGLIENPRMCPFDPKEIQCTGADGPSCLTAEQVEAVREIYSPVTNPRTKEKVNSQQFIGSELGWRGLAGAEPFPNSVDFFKWVVFGDPKWDYKSRPVNYDSDVALANRPENVVINSTDPNIGPFIRRGGKLLMIEGWADATIAPGAALDYYDAVLKTAGNTPQVRNSIRLFMVPGMGHCLGTTGAEAFDFDSLKAVQDWKATGKAPDQIVVTRYQNGKEAGKRLVCAHPQVTSYKGSGNPNDAANFTCKMP